MGNLANLTELYLSRNELSGEIPPELGNLTNLTRLGLYGNQFSGEIPPELGNLANLTVLYIQQTQLTGCVPSGLSGRLDMDNSKSSEKEATKMSDNDARLALMKLCRGIFGTRQSDRDGLRRCSGVRGSRSQPSPTDRREWLACIVFHKLAFATQNPW